MQVQPVAELSELSRRGSSDGQQVELAAANIRGGTLRRSGSLRFHENMVSTWFSIINSLTIDPLYFLVSLISDDYSSITSKDI